MLEIRSEIESWFDIYLNELSELPFETQQVLREEAIKTHINLQKLFPLLDQLYGVFLFEDAETLATTIKTINLLVTNPAMKEAHVQPE